jgi:hypothetical protein
VGLGVSCHRVDQFVGQEKFRVWTLTVDPSFPAAASTAMLLLPFGQQSLSLCECVARSFFLTGAFLVGLCYREPLLSQRLHPPLVHRGWRLPQYNVPIIHPIHPSRG